MRLRIIILAVFCTVVLQLAWPRSVGPLGVTPNFFLILIVFLSTVIGSKQLIWVAFTGGFVLDLYTATDFGLHMASYVLLALFLGVVWRLELATHGLSAALYTVALATLTYGIILTIPVLRPEYIVQWRVVLGRLVLEIMYNVCIAVPLFGLMRLRQRGVLGS